MFYKSIKLLFLLVTVSFLTQSCDKDTNVLESEEVIIQNRVEGDQNQNGPRGQGTQGDGQDGPDNNGQSNRPPMEMGNDLIVEWMDLFLELERYAGGMRPNASARAIAYINLAAYETAVPGMRGFISNSQLLPGLNINNTNTTRNIDWELALNACYADVLDHFLLNVPANLLEGISTLENALEEEFSNGQSAQRITDSKNWGAEVAQQIIAYSQTDTEGEKQILNPQPASYVPPTGAGYWTFSAEPERALFPYWENVRTFVISPEETTTIAPIAYSENPGSPYYEEMLEAYTANNEAREEDGEDLWIAEFWSDDVEGITFSPPARQVSIANQLIDNRNLDMETSLHLLLKLGFSLNDAAVSTWKYKYEHMVMRPSVFIHKFIDPTYQTNLYRLIPWPNPTFPGYPSGHSSFASAAAGVFIDFFGNNINFTDRSHAGRTEFRGRPRNFQSFEDMATENGYSRLPLGVHIKMDCTEGLRLGYEISAAINQHNVQRVGG